MLTDPEPNYCVSAQDSEHPEVASHTCRIDRPRLMHSLELEAWVMRVLSEYAVRLTCIIANLNRQLRKAIPKRSIRARIHSFSGSSSVVRPASRSARASSAIWPRRSCDWSNMSVHRLSDASSADSH